MKKETDHEVKEKNRSSSEVETINTISNDSTNGQPVPQPKDYDEIEY